MTLSIMRKGVAVAGWFVVAILAVMASAAEARTGRRSAEVGSTGGMGPDMRLHPVWGTRVYVNETVGFHVWGWGTTVYATATFGYPPRDFGQCAAATGGAGVVVCGVKSGDVVALASESGRIRWTFRTDGAVRARPLVLGPHVFVGSSDGCLYRLDVKTGRPTWVKPFCTDAAVYGDPVSAEEAGDRLVLFPVTINKVYAVRAEDGTFRWEYHRDRPQFMSSEGLSSPTVSGDKVFVGFSDGVLVALKVQGGALVWSVALAESGQKATDVDATPVVDGDWVYSASFARGPVAVAAADGRIRWQGSWFGATRPALKGTWLVFGTADGDVVGVRKADGSAVFRTRLEGSGAVYGPVVVKDWIVVGHDRGLVLLDGGSGAPVERLAVPMGIFAAPEVQGGRLFFVGAGGTVNAVDVLPR